MTAVQREERERERERERESCIIYTAAVYTATAFIYAAVVHVNYSSVNDATLSLYKAVIESDNGTVNNGSIERECRLCFIVHINDGSTVISFYTGIVDLFSTLPNTTQLIRLSLLLANEGLPSLNQFFEFKLVLVWF